MLFLQPLQSLNRYIFTYLFTSEKVATMTTTHFPLDFVHSKRNLLFPASCFQHPITSEQLVELASLIKPALKIGEGKTTEWRNGHEAGILLALTVLERSHELHPEHSA